MQGAEIEDDGSVLKYMTKSEIEEQRSSLLIMTQRRFFADKVFKVFRSPSLLPYHFKSEGFYRADDGFKIGSPRDLRFARSKVDADVGHTAYVPYGALGTRLAMVARHTFNLNFHSCMSLS